MQSFDGANEHFATIVQLAWSV